ncbi:MAG: superoxide dismutase [Rickettsiales bacterium]|nr:superoxide dismutase [Rickettsiales bacterium]
MAFTLPALPYAMDALEPNLSKETLEFHHGKHHNAYVVKLNELVAGSPMEAMSLEDIIKKTAGSTDAKEQGIFNNAAQIWNHTFYWHCMAPKAGGKPEGELASRINAEFGSYEKFVEAFKNAGITQFGSGWAWLILDKSGKLAIRKTPNADLPMAHGEVALLTMDVWEHAYYIDYRNKRPDYIDTFLGKLVNWAFVAENLEKSNEAKAA